MSVVPYAVGGATPLVVAGARYVAREGFAGAVEGAGAGIRKRVRDALSGSHNGTSNAGQSTASATKVPRSVPRMRRLQRQMIQDCCESLFETKIKTSSFTDLRPEPTSYFALVNQLPQGTGDEGRVGNRISSRFLKVKINTAQGTSPTAMRVLVVIDRAANHTAAVHSDCSIKLSVRFRCLTGIMSVVVVDFMYSRIFPPTTTTYKRKLRYQR